MIPNPRPQNERNQILEYHIPREPQVLNLNAVILEEDDIFEGTLDYFDLVSDDRIQESNVLEYMQSWKNRQLLFNTILMNKKILKKIKRI